MDATEVCSGLIVAERITSFSDEIEKHCSGTRKSVL